MISWFAAVYGACLGSFLNVCIYRLPREGLSVRRPRRSFCPACEAPIAWYDNIPILSWIILGARCRACRGRISLRYPLVEALTALGFFIAVRVTIGQYGIAMWPLALVWAALFAALIVITFIDIDFQIIPDEISVTGAAIAPGAALLVTGLPPNAELPAWLAGAISRAAAAVPWKFGETWLVLAAACLALIAMPAYRAASPLLDGEPRTWWETRLAGALAFYFAAAIGGTLFVAGWLGDERGVRLAASLFGLLAGSGSIYAIGVVGKWAFRKDAMGFGDVKLMALLGAVLGWRDVLIAIFVACLVGSVIGIAIRIAKKSSYIPFGPFLSVGAVTLILFRAEVDAAIGWYLNLWR